MNQDIVAALEHCRDAAHRFIEAVDEFVEQGRELTPNELSMIEQHWGPLRTAREEYENALVAAGHDRPNI